MSSPTRSIAATAHALVPALDPGLVRELAHFVDHAPEQGTLDEIVDWVDGLFEWLRQRGDVTLPHTAPIAGRSAGARLWLLVRALEAAPHAAERVRRTLGILLEGSSALSFFTDTGRALAGGFFSEAFRRVTRPLLPEAPEVERLAYVVGRLFDGEDAADWLDALPLRLVEEAAEVLVPRRAWRPVRASLVDTIDVLGTRIAGLGLAEDVRVRGSGGPVSDAPFMRVAELALWTAAQLRAADASEAPEMSPAEAGGHLLDALDAADSEVEVVLGHLEEFGVSVNLVYRLEQLNAAVDRLRLSLEVLIPPARGNPRAVALRLFSQLVREHLRDQSVLALTRSTVRQLARKVIERAGETGEHYITSTRAELKHMLTSAAGGGVLTAGTTFAKFIIQGMAFPGLLLAGIATSVNYAASFVILQLLGFTLATKQPSMTAATLAGALGEARGARDYVALVDHIARTVRSNFAAIVGNLGAVAPTAIAGDVLWRIFTGHSFLTDEQAHYVLHSHDPLGSGTLVFAALTGALLWLSSVAAGSLENWVVYRRLPEALARHRRLRRWLGPDGAARVGELLRQYVSSLGGSIILGFMLGLTATFGKFFGLPLDVRHVTLSTGSLALAIAALGVKAAWAGGLVAALAGVACIGTLNFVVSFSLAIMVALRAREVSRQDTVRVAVLTLRRLLRDPRPFFLPPRDDGAAPPSRGY